MKSDTLDRLEKWTKKFRKATIIIGPNIMPGDEIYIKLEDSRSGIKVEPYFYDLCVYPMGEDGRPDAPIEPTIDQMLCYALDLWDDEEAKRAIKGKQHVPAVSSEATQRVL